ncbi:hypothetical protein [Devosia sp.]|uniref:hypothetical protein n=1 Tax=Devosia sp. TaxID=1871048 RepID=UPI003265BEFF
MLLSTTRRNWDDTMRTILIIAALLSSTYATSARDITRCLIEVDGTIWADGPCEFDAFEKGYASFEVVEKAEPQTFAYVYVNQNDEPTNGVWNGGEGAMHAHDPLGELHRQGACWVNERAKVCAWQ